MAADPKPSPSPEQNEMYLAEAEKAREEARIARAQARKEEIDLAKKEQEEAKRLASDEHHHVYRFTESIGDVTAKKCMDELSIWHRLDGKKPQPITIVFNSPGGSVIAGMALFDHIQELRHEKHHVTIVGQGMAASMAGILLQAGDERILTAESWLLIHEGSFGAVGSVAEVEDTVEWVKQISERILNIFAARCKASGAPKPLTKAQIKARYRRKDWWISSDDALKYGFIDRIASTLEVA